MFNKKIYSKNHNNRKKRRKAGYQVHNFSINNKIYSIRLSDHAEKRLKQRQLDLYQIIGSILSLGQNRIEFYSGNNKDIFILDKQNNFSIVCNITNRTIVIVTVIDNANCFIKNGTIAVNL